MKKLFLWSIDMLQRKLQYTNVIIFYISYILVE